MKKLTVAIATHNPKPVTVRVVEALRRQTLPVAEWDLLVIDNASEIPASRQLDLSWHPGSAFIREERLGVTFARQRAFRECRTDLLTFVDDDNVLEADFLEKTLEIARDHPKLGCWGPARILPEFEAAPSATLRKWSELLMHYDVPRDTWACLPYGNRSVPPTAGATFRRVVWERWLSLNEGDDLRSLLGRRGKSLMSAEDVDLALCAPDLGLGTGIFRALQMTHVFPARRTTLPYLLGMWETHAYSDELLDHIRGINRKGRGARIREEIKHAVKVALMCWSMEGWFLFRVKLGRWKARIYLKKNGYLRSLWCDSEGKR